MVVAAWRSRVYVVRMDDTHAAGALSALAQSTRMKVFVMLVAARDVGMASSEIADALQVPRNLMSSHLAILSGAGLIVSEKSGRSVRYFPVPDVMIELSDHLRRLASSA
jgi:ArsR family transcriptional regulator